MVQHMFIVLTANTFTTKVLHLATNLHYCIYQVYISATVFVSKLVKNLIDTFYHPALFPVQMFNQVPCERLCCQCRHLLALTALIVIPHQVAQMSCDHHSMLQHAVHEFETSYTNVLHKCCIVCIAL